MHQRSTNLVKLGEICLELFAWDAVLGLVVQLLHDGEGLSAHSLVRHHRAYEVFGEVRLVGDPQTELRNGDTSICKQSQRSAKSRMCPKQIREKE